MASQVTLTGRTCRAFVVIWTLLCGYFTLAGVLNVLRTPNATENEQIASGIAIVLGLLGGFLIWALPASVAALFYWMFGRSAQQPSLSA